MKSIKRVHKQYDERMKELLDAASALFVEKGYQRTTVNDIIDKVGVAKGTFYHYFEAKVDILHELAERYIDTFVQALDRILQREDCDAMGKLRLIIQIERDLVMGDRQEFTVMLFKTLYMEENLELRYHVLRTSHKTIAPQMARLIRQGVDEGAFSVSDPDNAALILMLLNDSVEELIFELLMQGKEGEADVESLGKLYRAYEEAFCRVLGLAAGAVSFITQDDLARFAGMIQ